MPLEIQLPTASPHKLPAIAQGTEEERAVTPQHAPAQTLERHLRRRVGILIFALAEYLLILLHLCSSSAINCLPQIRLRLGMFKIRTIVRRTIVASVAALFCWHNSGESIAKAKQIQPLSGSERAFGQADYARRIIFQNLRQEAIWKVTLGDFEFHDTRSRQLALDINCPDFEPLKSTLQNKFSGQGYVRIEDVIEFVGSDRTDYYSGQLKTKTLKPMENEGKIKIDGRTRRRKGTYPDGARIQFL